MIRLRAALLASVVACSLAVSRPGVAQDSATVVVGDRVRAQVVGGASFDGSLLQLHADSLALQLWGGDQIELPLASLVQLQVHRGRRRRFTAKRSMLYGVGAFAAYTAVIMARSEATRRDAGLAPLMLVALGAPAGLVFRELVWMDRWEGVLLPLEPGAPGIPLYGIQLSFTIPVR